LPTAAPPAGVIAEAGWEGGGVLPFAACVTVEQVGARNAARVAKNPHRRRKTGKLLLTGRRFIEAARVI